MSYRRAVVLGGGGFIGRHLCCRLAVEGWDVVSLSRSDVIFPEGLEIKTIIGDVADEPLLASAIRGANVVFHVAHTRTPSHAQTAWSDDLVENLFPLQNVINLCSEEKAKLIFASSGGTVYGVPATLPADEEAAAAPISAYGVTKLCQESYIRLGALHSGLNAIVLRISNPFGPGQRWDRGQGVIASFLKSVIDGKSIEVWGDGSIVRDFLYIDDLIEAFVRAADYECGYEIFNIGSGVGRSIKEVIDSIQAALKVSLDVSFLGQRSFDVPAIVLDVQKASKKLSWRASDDFYEQLRRTFVHLGGCLQE